MNKKINVLDVTIRDGSYAVGFGYTKEDVRAIVRRLNSSGVEWAEIGHGLGFGSDKAGFPHKATDIEQIRAAALPSGRIKLGVIGSPPVLNTFDLSQVARHLDFVRLACNVIAPEPLAAAIPVCKKLGLKVFVQMMRATSVSPKEAASSAKKLSQYGAEVIYIVDTAGSVLPDEVGEYIRRAKDASRVTVGFHGHNNLGLALANTIAGIRAGANFVDASLKGIGRASGNVPIEILAIVLQKLKIKSSINIKKILSAAEDTHLKLYQYLPKPPASDAYFAFKNRDFFPHYILEAVAKELGLGIYDIIDDLASLPPGRELNLDDLGDVIAKHKRNENKIYKKIGLIP